MSACCVIECYENTSRGCGAPLHVGKSAAASLLGRCLVQEGMKAGRAQTDSLEDDRPGMGMGVHFFPSFESSESRSVWPGLRMITASHRWPEEGGASLVEPRAL